ncbi:hypothetical protein GCM10010371_52990 [Streptomyces subrutilus]|uniref:IPT/TIG domain-containing protein n=1 Tax=Streptomyces subrutilus TaxID=36818 RepID=A0A918VBM7_9ACTN|nr:hypothetical protein [Streptomyces subrutilus]GGZ86442.1 hypothetical protein GCM10010371_52990 [Streptomyces subrutilus]
MTHRWVSTPALLAVSITGLGLVAAPAAQAGTVTPTVHCSLPAGQGEATGPQSMTVELSPSIVDPGGSVHAKVTLGGSPATSGISLSNVPTTPSLDLAMSGGATGTVTVRGPEITMNVPANTPILIPPYEGDFLIPVNASGPISFAPIRTLTQTKVLGSTYQTPCDVTAGGGSVGTVTAQGTAGVPATLTAPGGTVRPSTSVPLSGELWTPGGTPVPALCDANGGGCDPGKFTSSTLSINAAKQLTGTATLAGAGTVPDGSYLVKVNDGAKEATAPLTVKAFTPTGPRAFTLSPNQGPVGSVITVSGTNHRQDQWINIVGLDAAGLTLDDTAVYVKTTPDGTFSGAFTVSDPAIVAVQTDEGGDPATTLTRPFTITAAAATLTTGAGKVKPGGTLTVSGTGWPAGAAPTASLCAADGSACDPALIGSSALTVAGDGRLAGSVSVASGAPQATYLLKVQANGVSQTAALTVAKYFIVLSTSNGPAGTKVTVVGQGFAPVATVAITGLKANGSGTSDGTKTKIVGLDGAFSQTFTVNDPATTAIRVKEVLVNPRTAVAAFTVGTGTPPPAAGFALSPDSGKAGTVVQVTGSGFAPVATVAVTGRRADGSQTSDSYVTRIIGLDGTFALNFTVKDPSTVALRACEILINGKTVQRAFTVL